MRPKTRIMTHSKLDGQETPWRPMKGVASSTAQALGTPLVGFVEVAIPNLPTATHSGPGTHETSSSAPGRVGKKIVFQALAPPVGLVDVNSPPPPFCSGKLAVTTHDEIDAHETPLSRRLLFLAVKTSLQA